MTVAKRLRAIHTNLQRARWDWQQGRSSGYPRCCIAMYCWDHLWGLSPGTTRCSSQAVQAPDDHTGWVPCGLVHRGSSPLSFRERAWRIVRFWLLAFRYLRGGMPQPLLTPPWTLADTQFPPMTWGDEFGPTDIAWRRLDQTLGVEEEIAVAPVGDPPGDPPARADLDEHQLSIFPRPRVAVEFFPSDRYVAADGDCGVGCFRAWVRGLGSLAGQGGTVNGAVGSLAAALQEFALGDGTLGEDASQPLAWVARATTRLGTEELAALLLTWAETPVLAEQVPSS